MIYRFGDLVLDTGLYLLERGDAPVAVEPQVFDLLVYLIDNRDRVVTRDELLENLWPGKVVTDSALSARLKAARKAVGDSGTAQQVIKTHHGRGYQFVSPMKSETEQISTQPRETAGSSEPPDKPSIAVLHFENLSRGDPQAETLSDGITEDIVNTLSRLPTIVVIASYSTRMYKNQPIDVRQVAREQDVRYVLEGSVQLSGKRTRISAQLIDATSGQSIWGDRYDRELSDVFQVQDDIMRSIVTALQVELISGQDVLDWGEDTDNVPAWLCVTRASDLLNLYVREATLEARQLGERALELDPDCAPAWNILGWAHYEDALWEWTGDRISLLDQAMECGGRGLALNRDNPNPYDWSVIGCAHLLRGEFDQAIKNTRAAVKVAPGSHENIMILAMVLAYAEYTDEALQLARQAMRLCPIPPPWSLLVFGICYFVSDRYAEALELFDKAVKQEPRSALPHIWLANTLVQTGNMEGATIAAVKLLEIEPSFSCGRWFGLTLDRPILKNPALLKTVLDNLRKAGVPA